MIVVDVVRAWARRAELVRLRLPPGTSARDAVVAAGWSDDPEVVALAVHGQRVAPESPLRDGDRVELLRPLLADPKDARRRRAASRRP